MKKLILFLGLIIAPFASKAQNIANGRVITHFTATQTMVWSESDKKNLYFDKNERYPEDNIFQTSLNLETGSGKVVVTNVGDETDYTFMIYDYEAKPRQFNSELGEYFDVLILDATEISSSNKVQFVFLKFIESGRHMVSVYLPSDQLVIHCDNLEY